MFSNSPRIRQAIYCLAIASQIASFWAAVFAPDLVVPFVATSGLLTTVAGGTALSNVAYPAVVEPAPVVGVDSGFTRDDTGFNS